MEVATSTGATSRISPILGYTDRPHQRQHPMEMDRPGEKQVGGTEGENLQSNTSGSGKGEIVFVSDGSNVGGGGTLFQWQALRPEQCHEIDERLRTQGVNRDGSLKHSYNEDEWRLVPLGHWNWKSNAARSKYHTYQHELRGGVPVLAIQQRIIGNTPITWLCDQDSVKYFMDSPPPEQKRLRRWWVFLSQLRLAVHHIQGLKNEQSDYLSRNSFD